MKKIIVNISNYTPSEYMGFIDSIGLKPIEEIERPNDTKYEIGEVVYISSEHAIGVVLGVIDNEREELRTDMSGMVSFPNLRPATLEDFNLKGVKFVPRLKAECEGKEVSYDWETYEETIA